MLLFVVGEMLWLFGLLLLFGLLFWH